MQPLGIVLLFGTFISFASSQTEDFGFEQENVQTQTLSPLRRLWGIPDSKAHVGKYVQISIPVDAFEGVVSKYEATGEGGRPLPSWLRLDPTTGTLEGVPADEDVGEVYIAMVAISQQRQHTAKDYFAIEVLPHSYSQQPVLEIAERCSPGEDVTTLTIAIDKDYRSMSTDNKISLLTNLARYLGMSYEKLSLMPQDIEELLTDSAIKAGPGNVKRKSADHSSVVQWQIGCDGKVEPKYLSQIQQIKHDSYDGTLAEVIQLPIIGWHLSVSSSNPPFRHRRQIVGSGDSDIDTEDTDIEDDTGPSGTGIDEMVPESRIIPIAVSPVFAEPSTTVPVDVHPHRHHHSVPPVYIEPTYTSLLTSPVPFATIMPTPTYDPERPAVLPTLLVTTSQEMEEFSVVPTPVINLIEPSVTPEMPTPQESDPIVVENFSEQSSTEALTTAPPPTESTTKQQEEVISVQNNPPAIKHKLPRQATTAGKPFRYIIPETVFLDPEEGNTRKLHLTLKTLEGSPVTYSWIYFNPENQEVIALPLEDKVSKWTFTLEARDSEGLAVNDTLELSVQHHKGRRTVTHALTLDLALQSTPPPVEWQLTLVERLATLYGDQDAAHITVLKVTPQDDPITFTWTNDSLPRNHCPRDQIDNLLKVLRANEDGKPTDAVRNLLSPQITVVRVSWIGKGACGENLAPEPLPPSIQNFAPTPRNQVDLINATLGQLLVYAVPEDTFYDPEDGTTRDMKLSLLNMDHSPLTPTHWLQFDVKNQEFYGIPMVAADIGKTEYELVCKDSGGLTAYDSLVVVVQQADKTLYNVEFSMTIDIPHDTFAYNPAMKRHFVERLAELFGDKNASAIVLSGVSANPTHIVWHNRSLPTDVCPNDQIKHLREILLSDDDRVLEEVNKVLGLEFPVVHASLIPTGRCQGALTKIHPVEPVYPAGDVRPISRSSEEYLVTVVVPAVVIAAMLLCAGLVACALYRRRRTGKMSVGSEDERQSFRSKGIPVIFQDELEERPEPANKSPVIMKEEKPPLPPPEYHQRTALLSDTDHHEDSPYQPPPPFTSSRDSARPKPTPTYRMPPPYVPP